MPDQPAKLIFGNVELRLDERRLLVDGQPIALGSRGFDLLRALVYKRDRVVSKDELLDDVWPGLVVEENNLQVQVSGLRRVLGAQAIATVAGFGYRFTLARTAESATGLAPTVAPLSATPTPKAVPGQALFAAATATPAPTPSSAAVAFETAHILVADDNKVNRLLLCRSLELMGHRVSSAENGQQAVAMMQTQRFDLLLLDISMPELDGFGVLQKRANDVALQDVSVIVTSALDGVAPVARCIDMGADDFLHKPVDPALLKARVASSLARKKQRDLQNDTLRRLTPGGPGLARCVPSACVLVARVQGFDAFASHTTAQEMVESLSSWCTLMFDAVEAHAGEVAQFSGDAMTVLFSNPQATVQAGRDIVEVLKLFNAESAAKGQTPIALGIGVALGPVLIGTALTTQRAAYVCMGEPVARAQALCAACSQLGHALLMDETTQAALAANLKTRLVKDSQVSPAFTLQ
jgi:adenylate cyclase